MNEEIKISINRFNFSYDGKIKVLHNISLDIVKNEITCFIGPSGCGKSTLLKCINSVNESIKSRHSEGIITIDGHQILEKGEPTRIRSEEYKKPRVSMVKQRYSLEHHSVFHHIAQVLKEVGIHNKSEYKDRVEYYLKKVCLWEEVKDRLLDSAQDLSRGQQQRLSLAVAIAGNADIILLDCPTSALDPVSTEMIEELLVELKEKHTILLVTNMMGLAARVSEYTAFLYQGQVYEYDRTTKVFMNPAVAETEYFVTHGFV